IALFPRLVLLRYRKCLPSGKNQGRMCPTSPSDGSRVVSGVTTPPPWCTLKRPVVGVLKIIVPSRFQEAPIIVFGSSQIVCGGPPEASTFLSFPCTRNPMERLSGDQNGT